MLLLVFFFSQFGVCVGYPNVEFFSTINDFDSFLGRDTMGNFSTVLAVVHKQELEFSKVIYTKLVKTIWKQEFRSFV